MDKKAGNIKLAKQKDDDNALYSQEGQWGEVIEVVGNERDGSWMDGWMDG